jgi:hypothetical protein
VVNEAAGGLTAALQHAETLASGIRGGIVGWLEIVSVYRMAGSS